MYSSPNFLIKPFVVLLNVSWFSVMGFMDIIGFLQCSFWILGAGVDAKVKSPFWKRLHLTVSIKELLWVSVNDTFNALFSLMLLSIIEKSGNDSFVLLSCFLNRVLVSFLDTS